MFSSSRIAISCHANWGLAQSKSYSASGGFPELKKGQQELDDSWKAYLPCNSGKLHVSSDSRTRHIPGDAVRYVSCYTGSSYVPCCSGKLCVSGCAGKLYFSGDTGSRYITCERRNGESQRHEKNEAELSKLFHLSPPLRVENQSPGWTREAESIIASQRGQP